MKKRKKAEKKPARIALSALELARIQGGRRGRGDDDDGPIIIISPDGP